jgi:hypothetical protein
MLLARRVAHRARVLIERGASQSAFLLGVIFGGSITAIVLFFH